MPNDQSGKQIAEKLLMHGLLSNLFYGSAISLDSVMISWNKWLLHIGCQLVILLLFRLSDIIP